MRTPASPLLLAAVERAVEQHGLAFLTVDQIAQEAGLSRVTLYRRGLTREGLLTQAVLAAADEFKVAALPALTHPGSGAERLERLLVALFDLADAHLALLSGLFDGPSAVFHLDVPGHDPEVLTRFEYTEPFERVLADGVADGTLQSTNPNEDAELLFNVAGWSYVHLRRSHKWTARRARAAVNRIALRGLAAPT
ncbi:MAG: TetR/AcrR family transcriptional regulator [Cryobacterium sp.]|nr:TetR/AcrR family transcriptional regulator [Cryobacterium sp.]